MPPHLVAFAWRGTEVAGLATSAVAVRFVPLGFPEPLFARTSLGVMVWPCGRSGLCLPSSWAWAGVHPLDGCAIHMRLALLHERLQVSVQVSLVVEPCLSALDAAHHVVAAVPLHRAHADVQVPGCALCGVVAVLAWHLPLGLLDDPGKLAQFLAHPSHVLLQGRKARHDIDERNLVVYSFFRDSVHSLISLVGLPVGSFSFPCVPFVGDGAVRGGVPGRRAQAVAYVPVLVL